MKNWIKNSAGALLLATAAVASHAATPADVLDAFHAALANGDSAKAQSLLAPQLLVFESGHVERSRSEYAGHHLPADMEFAQATRRKVLQQIVRDHGQFAVITQETETTGTFRDKPVHLFGTETAVLQRDGDQWTITHVHWSSRKKK